VPVGDEDVAVGRDDDVGRPAERVGPLGVDARSSERHQDLALGAELEHLMSLAVFALRVGHPDVSFPVDRHAVRLHEHIGPEAAHELPGRIELEQRRLVPMEHPDVALRIRIDRDDAAKGDARREVRPVGDDVIRIVLGAERRCDDDRRDESNDRGQLHVKGM
jgi:hypothetical protein